MADLPPLCADVLDFTPTIQIYTGSIRQLGIILDLVDIVALLFNKWNKRDWRSLLTYAGKPDKYIFVLQQVFKDKNTTDNRNRRK